MSVIPLASVGALLISLGIAVFIAVRSRDWRPCFLGVLFTAILAYEVHYLLSESLTWTLPLALLQDQLAHLALAIVAISAALLLARTLRERSELLAALHCARDHMSGFAENLPGSIFRRLLHHDGRISYAFISEGEREAFGLDPDEMVRDADCLSRVLHPDDHEG